LFAGTYIQNKEMRERVNSMKGDKEKERRRKGLGEGEG
jgi:hypothetical protein